MSAETFRAAVTGLVQAWMQANHPSIPVCWENGPHLDPDTTDVYLDVEFDFLGGRNVSVGDRGRGRDRGVLRTNLYVRMGEGTALADTVLPGLRELLRNRREGDGVLEFPGLSSSPPMLGWRRFGLQTPFYVDSA